MCTHDVLLIEACKELNVWHVVNTCDNTPKVNTKALGKNKFFFSKRVDLITNLPTVNALKKGLKIISICLF